MSLERTFPILLYSTNFPEIIAFSVKLPAFRKFPQTLHHGRLKDSSVTGQNNLLINNDTSFSQNSSVSAQIANNFMVKC